jgi:hypothetical protein
LVYHDPDKELLLTHFPPEMGVNLEEQQKSIGPLINKVVNSLPQEKRKGYLLNPKTILTIQGMLETVLEADGITKEMIEAQEERLNLIQRLLGSSEDVRINTIHDEDELIDGDFFGILTRLMESAVIQQDEDSAKKISELQNDLLEHSSQGKIIKAEAQAVQEAIRDLQNLGENVNREEILDLVLKADSDSKLRAYTQVARQAFDYQFFQILSERIERSRQKGKERLKSIREKLLDFTKEVDDAIAVRSEIALKNVEAILQAEDLREALENNSGMIDEFFVQAVINSLEKARNDGDLEHSSRLQEILNIINELTKPPAELEFIEELVEIADDQEALEEAIGSQMDLVSPEMIQMITSIISQTMAGVDQEGGEQDLEREELLSKLNSIHAALLKFSMRQSFLTK